MSKNDKLQLLIEKYEDNRIKLNDYLSGSHINPHHLGERYQAFENSVKEIIERSLKYEKRYLSDKNHISTLQDEILDHEMKESEHLESLNSMGDYDEEIVKRFLEAHHLLNIHQWNHIFSPVEKMSHKERRVLPQKFDRN